MMDSSIGRGTRIHVIVDEESKPIAVALSPGNIHDSKMFNLTIR
jgi:transposase